MAALSVERPGLGKKTGYGNPAEAAAARRPEFEATPPETINARAPMFSADAAARDQQFLDRGVLERSQQVAAFAAA